MQEFLKQAYHLKHLDRAGWLRVGIEQPESVAAHSWGLALLCTLFAPNDLDKEKLLKMAIIHDLPEIETGDITPHDGISKQEKHRREDAAAQRLFPPDFYLLWKECQQKQSPEAQFIQLMDKLDMALQAKQYEKQADTSEFITSALSVLNTDTVDLQLQSLVKHLL